MICDKYIRKEKTHNTNIRALKVVHINSKCIYKRQRLNSTWDNQAKIPTEAESLKLPERIGRILTGSNGGVGREGQNPVGGKACTKKCAS